MVSRLVEDVKKQMVQNLDTVLARGEKIEELVASTSSLNTKYVSQSTVVIILFVNPDRTFLRVQ